MYSNERDGFMDFWVAVMIVAINAIAPNPKAAVMHNYEANGPCDNETETDKVNRFFAEFGAALLCT